MIRTKFRTLLAVFVIAILALVLVYMTPPITIRSQNLINVPPKHSATPYGKSKTISPGSNVQARATSTPANS